MKLEFFPQSKSKPVLLIYDGTPEEVVRLQQILRQISEEITEQAGIHLLPGVQSIDGCKLFIRLNKANEEIKKISDNCFEWLLTVERCGDVADMLQGLLEPWRGGHTFLNSDGKISIIISSGRGWQTEPHKPTVVHDEKGSVKNGP